MFAISVQILCDVLGAHLVEIGGEEENTFIRKTVAKGGRGKIFLGRCEPQLHAVC